MRATTAWGEARVMPDLRDALRSLIGCTDDADSAWRLAEDEVSEGLATVGQLRQLLDVAEVTLVREGLTRGLPAQESWSPHDWVSHCEAKGAPVPDGRQVSKVVRVAKRDPRVAEVTAAFVAGGLPLGKADQLIRFERVTGLATKELAVAITQTGRLLTPDKDLEDDDRKAKAGRCFAARALPG